MTEVLQDVDFAKLDPDDCDWYYIDRHGQQKGPVLRNLFKIAWEAGETLETSWVWNETMDGWSQISNLSKEIRDLFISKNAKVGQLGHAVASKAIQSQQQQASKTQQPTSPITDAKAPEVKAAEEKPKKKAAPAGVRYVEEEYFEGWRRMMTPDGVPYFLDKETGEVTWDDPKDLLARPGEWVWLPHEEEGFLPARKLETYYDGRIEVETEDGQKHLVLPTTTLLPLTWSSTRRLVRDLVMLDDMNPPLILHNLKKRFEMNEIYTNIGTILISVNPYKRLDIYTPSVMDEYRYRGSKNLAPHVYAVADNAFAAIVERHSNQAVIISGESGSGKTEATKQCLQYLADIAGSESLVEQKILLANPVLEAFGNAKTVRNNNSSRFGKYVEIFFDQKYSICGATNTNYLLEKIRVVHHDAQERNYHIFYQICQGCSSEQRAAFKLERPAQYHYLNQATKVDIEGVDDSAEFAVTEAAMLDLNFDRATVHSIFQIVSALLHLGNIGFVGTGEKKCEIQDRTALERCAILLGVPAEALVRALTCRVMVVRGAEIEKPNSAEEALSSRDTLAKFVYARLFDWLVQYINHLIGSGDSSPASPSSASGAAGTVASTIALPLDKVMRVRGLTRDNAGAPGSTGVPSPPKGGPSAVGPASKAPRGSVMGGVSAQDVTGFDRSKLKKATTVVKGLVPSAADILSEKQAQKVGGGKLQSIGILDIFGFEIFNVNSFEQLCINFANEKLQQFFNDHTFRQEEQVYVSENIHFEHVKYIDNQEVCDLIEKKPDGILPAIEEELRMPKGNDNTLLSKVCATSKNSRYERSMKKPNEFVVSHYAGRVTYDSTGFLDKNKDKLHDDLLDLCKSTHHPFLKSLVSNEETTTSASGRPTNHSVGMKFNDSLSGLMSTLRLADPHYIRCVKPNNSKQAGLISGPLVLQQLQYSGVFEAVEIRKKGYPFRYTYEDFFKRFKVVDPKVGVPKTGKAFRDACIALIKKMKQNPATIQMGSSMVLYRSEQHKSMELQRNVGLDVKVRLLQRKIRGWEARVLFALMRKVKPLLTVAIAKRDLDLLIKALELSEGLKFPLREWEAGKKLKPILVEEKRIRDLINTLLPQDPEVVHELLVGVCEDAANAPYDTPLVAQARERRDEVPHRKRARKALVQSTLEADEAVLSAALEEIKRYPEFETNSKEELALGRAMMQRIVKEKEVIAVLDRALERGAFLNEKDVVEYEGLEGALVQARNFNMMTSQGIVRQLEVELILEVRKPLKLALGTKDAMLWKAVEDALVSAVRQIPKHPQVIAAVDMVGRQRNREDICERLEVAARELDQPVLEYGLRQADELRMNPDKYPVLPVARNLLDKIVACRAAMSKARDQVELTQLEKAVELAEQLDYETPEVIRARELRNRVAQLNIEAEYARTVVEEVPMREIVQQAEAIKLASVDILALRALLDLPEEKFVQEQLKAAVKLGDTMRAKGLTILLKELFFRRTGDTIFALSKFHRLRSPLGWAGLKAICLNREALANGMLKWSKAPIHATLTEILDPVVAKTGVKLFRNILGYMGDRHYNYPLMLAKEALRECLKEEALRNELLIQIFKQLTENPSKESRDKGHELLLACLETFPPDSQFENFAEVWIRKNVDANRTHQLLDALHTTVFEGVRDAPPTEEDIQQIIAGQALRAHGFQHRAAYTAPKVSAKPNPTTRGRGATTRLKDSSMEIADAFSVPSSLQFDV